jgi:hypothetical protein
LILVLVYYIFLDRNETAGEHDGARQIMCKDKCSHQNAIFTYMRFFADGFDLLYFS